MRPNTCYICGRLLLHARSIALVSPNGCKAICRSCQIDLNTQRTFEAAQAKAVKKSPKRKKATA